MNSEQPGTPERGSMQWGPRCSYKTVLWVISWFIKIDLKQIYSSYAIRAHMQFRMVFYLIYIIIFEVNSVADHVNAKRMTIIMHFYTDRK